MGSLTLLGVGTVLTAAALVVLVSNPRSTSNRFFAAFLALVAANFAFDWMARAFFAPVPSEYGPCGYACNPWHRLANVLLPFDAAALLYFTAIYPRRSRLARFLPYVLAPALVAHSAAATLDIAGVAPLEITLTLTLRIVFFHACYLGSLALAVRSLLISEFPTSRAAARPLVAALLLIVAPRAALAGVDLLLTSTEGTLRELPLRIGVTLAVVFATLAALSRESPSERARTRPWILAAVAFILVVFVAWSVAIALPSYLVSSLIFGLRWPFFAGLVAYALTRDAFLDIDKRIFAGTKGGVPLLAALGAFIALWLVLGRIHGHGDAGVSTSGLLSISGALVVGVGVTAARGVATPPDPFSIRKLDAYRALVEAHVEAQRDAADVELAGHRRRLRVSERQHDDIVALVLAERAVYATRGPAGALPEGYRALEVLSSGPACWTVLAERAQEPRRVVVKALRPEWRKHARVRATFEREGRLLAGVSDPHVVRVLAVHDRPPALVLELAEGGNLASLVAKRGPLPPAELNRLARELLTGLAALHAAGIVHRDIKPENVLLAADGRAVIADLGSARESPTEGTRMGMTAAGEVGTVLYMAPEQVLGRVSDARADLYSLAATLVCAATGRHYLEAEGASEFEVKRLIIEAPHRVPDAVPRELRALVFRCLQADPSARPADARAALDTLV